MRIPFSRAVAHAQQASVTFEVMPETSSIRHGLVRLGGALFGFATGIALLPMWLRPAPPGQLPSFSSRIGLDASASYHFFLGVVTLTLFCSWAAGPLARRVTSYPKWVLVTTTVALSSALWIALSRDDVWWVMIPPLLVTLAAVLLANVPQRFSRADVVLLPTFLCVFMAISDLLVTFAFGRRIVLAALACIAVRLLVPLFRSSCWRPAHCFLASPLGLLLQSHYNGYHQRHLGWPSLLIALGGPFLLALVRQTSRTRRRFRLASTLFVYPLTILLFSSATSTLAAEGKPHGDLFEDAHNLAVASDMLRGEHAYRDIVPTHGFIQDGLLDYLILRSGKQNAGRVIKTHGVIGSIVSVGGYFIATCVTGSPHVGILAYFFGAAIGTSGGGLRPAPAFFALAAVALGVRRRQPRWFGLASALVVLAAFTSIDFGAYAGVALLAAIIRMRSERKDAAIAAMIGATAAGAVSIIALGAAGILGPFVRTTFLEIARLGPVYSLTPFAPSDALRARAFPEVLATIFDRAAFPVIFWCLTLIGVAMFVQWKSRRTPLRPSIDALFVLGVFVIAAGLSYAERQHAYAQLVAGPVVVSAVAFVFVRRTDVRRWIGSLLVLAVIVLAQPTAYLTVIDLLRHTHGPLNPDSIEVAEVPRAHGALYRSADAAVIRSVDKYVSKLAPAETYFDFTNRGALYFLFDRDCPVRQVEVAFYEQESQQRDVIDRLSRNPHVRAALVPRSGDVSVMVDEVPNEIRAPLVWRYLQDHFRPEFEDGNVAFWRRVD